MKKLKMLLKNPYKLFVYLGYKGKLNWMNDKTYLKLFYRGVMGKKLNLKDPKTFNEKLQWLKLYDRKLEYSKMVDKYEAKLYVADKIGEEYIVPNYGIWDNFDDIDFDKLPDQFVLKCTHDCGGLIICRDKSKLDINGAREKINKCLKKEYFWDSREWPYKAVKPRIIAEKYMENSTRGLRDYKFYCFNGKVPYLYISEGLEDHATANISFLTRDWEFAPFGRSDYAPFSELPEKPEKFEKMLKIAEKLSEGHAFLRVDLYEIQGDIYFSELTFSPCSGMMPFTKEEWNNKLGDMIDLTLVEKTEG